MQEIIKAARRDVVGIFKLYIHFFFKQRWYKPGQGDIGHAAMLRIWPWAAGVIVPYALYSAVAATISARGWTAGIGEALGIAFLIWAVYRVYRIFKPESAGAEGEHVRGAEIDDLSSQGDQQ